MSTTLTYLSAYLGGDRAGVRSLNDRASQRCSVRSGASGASIPGVGAFSVTSSSKVERARVSRSCQKAPKAGRFDFPSSL
eukprot:6172818-Pleurochrysis_carterae.AAC.4